MRGIVLAGGLGTRLDPITRIINKHLLPVYDKPMIYYPIQTLVNAGIEDIMIVTGGRNAGDFLRLLGNGREFGLKHLDYTYQEGEGGIAEALDLARHFARGGHLCVILGDNIIERDVRKSVDAFRQGSAGAKILLKRVPDPGRYGVPRIEDGRVVRIDEKPSKPASDFAVTGIYMYDSTVFDRIARLERSSRGELEITDVNNSYIDDGLMEWEELDGWWIDAGTVDGLLRASKFVARTGANMTVAPRS
ncbi:MAG: sugar phosphate nucleotidyltransferase [Bryobacterales bacterium]|nr:sugar phosphate nucleotidyltransferase [Bryobacterales bacterium]